MALYRICQECLNNIQKHADATRVRIQLERQANNVYLNIADNGKGFTIRRCHGGKRGGRQGIGLLGIRERVNDLAGKFTLTSSKGKGTQVEIFLPINRVD
jgi:signal transduction histidine kinase